jgi:hypothetical protein
MNGRPAFSAVLSSPAFGYAAGTGRPRGDDGCIYGLPVDVSLDLPGELTCDWRDGDLRQDDHTVRLSMPQDRHSAPRAEQAV